VRHPMTIPLSAMFGLLLLAGSASGQIDWEERIKQAFSERAAKNHSFRIEYERDYFVTKLSQPEMMDGGGNKWMPHEDTTFHFSESIIWEGEDFMKSFRGPMFHATLGEYFDNEMIISEYQGYNVIFRAKLFDTNTPYAGINDGYKPEVKRTNYWLTQYDLLPIFFYSGRLDLINYDLDDYHLLPGISFFNDQECRVLEKLKTTNIPNRSGSVYRVWLASDLDFLPTRFLIDHNQNHLIDTSISYRKDQNNEWTISDWAQTNSGTNENGEMVLRTSSNITVSKSESGALLGGEDFHVEMPPLTFVDESNWHSGKEVVRKYILMPDGSERIVTNEEFSRISSHAELFNTPTGMAGFPKPQQKRRSMYVIIAILSASLLAIVIRRRLGRAEA